MVGNTKDLNNNETGNGFFVFLSLFSFAHPNTTTTL